MHSVPVVSPSPKVNRRASDAFDVDYPSYDDSTSVDELSSVCNAPQKTSRPFKKRRGQTGDLEITHAECHKFPQISLLSRIAAMCCSMTTKLAHRGSVDVKQQLLTQLPCICTFAYFTTFVQSPEVAELVRRVRAGIDNNCLEGTAKLTSELHYKHCNKDPPPLVVAGSEIPLERMRLERFSLAYKQNQ